MLISAHSNAVWMVVMTINDVVVSKWVRSVNNGWYCGYHNTGPSEILHIHLSQPERSGMKV